MSATRRTSRLNRATLSLPYVRTTKKPSWSLSGFLRSLNPLRSHSSTDDDRLSSDEESDSDNQEREEQILPSPGPSLFRREQQLTQNIPANGPAFPPPPPPAFPHPPPPPSTFPHPPPSTFPPPPPPTNKRPRTPQRQESTSKSGLPRVEFTFRYSPSQKLDTVSNFLMQHANIPMSREDIDQMVALLQQSKPAEQPLRSKNPCATIPPRSKSPNSLLPTSTSTAPRTLGKNPNGTYKWKGVCSSRAFRSRNTFSSPVIPVHPSKTFRAPATSTDAEALGNDRKRRRIGDPTTEPQDPPLVNGASLNQVSLPVASTATDSTSRTSTTTSLQSPPVATPVRQRIQVLQKPTAPVVPSPLRQAWTGGSPSGSESGSPQGPNPVRRTKTAQHVTDLVKSLNSQDKVVAEIRNPYELANPVKRPTMPKRKRVAPAKKPATAAPAPKETTTKIAKEMSVHAIIEATLPEGSKRSRPPADLEKADTQKDVTEELEAPAPKRLKPLTNGHKEYEDSSSQVAKATQGKPVTSHSHTTGAHVPTKPNLGPKFNMPKEPSKLRFSVQPESTSTPPSPAPEPKAELEVPKPVAQPIFTSNVAITVPPVSKNRAISSITNGVRASPQVVYPVATPTQKSVKDTARSQPLASLPSFTFTFPSSLSCGNVKVNETAKAFPLASLPTYDFTCNGVTVELSSSVQSFDWAAAGLKKPSTSSGGGWTCGECFLSNPATATTKCQTCEAPKP
ncbi:hypothetical protein Agabi119p4_6474 [Agaricus bisporus var. burnettii]|uniref:RanBP2-type domain-containing protein n=1 Tax=Agaricus bisporus var. burnettii TaxID=192524 RepID=A0A8H7F007_AGABI|nr:hypothetical protein Agabi119p4_6474 [Agaricus bisporus var. burnettii]